MRGYYEIERIRIMFVLDTRHLGSIKFGLRMIQKFSC